jgi:hypothetical protein
MKESQLRQLIREEISKTKKELNEYVPSPESLDPAVIASIIASLGGAVGGVALIKNKLKKMSQEGGKKGEAAQAILDFFEGLASGGGRG